MNGSDRPAANDQRRPSVVTLSWLRLATVTLPLLVVFFVLAAVQESVAVIRSALAVREDAGRGAPVVGVRGRAPRSVVFVPAEVWASPDVAVGQDDEAAVNGR